jgi:hypothetical protein
MHGMLSSAIILAAFALVAGAGGYTALWLYRATPGAPSRSRPSIAGWLGGLGRSGGPGELRVPDDEPDVFAGPGAPDTPEPRDTAEAADEEAAEFEPHGEAAESEPHGEAAESEPPEEAVDLEAPEETAGARLYVLHEPRPPRR